MLARAVGATDFRPSRHGGGGGRAAAHSLRECGRATARRRGQAAEPPGSGHTEGCTHVGAGGGRDRFSTIDKRRRGWAGGLPSISCESAGERGRDGAGRLPNLGDPVARRVARMLARVVPHSEACSGPTARVVDDQSLIRPSPTPPGTGSSTAVGGGAPSPFAPFLLAVVLAEVQSRQKSNHTESRSICMPQPVTKMRKSATDSLYIAGLSRQERSYITF